LSQWVIVAGLYYYFRQSDSSRPGKYISPFLFLGFIAGALHPYIALFAMLLGACAILRSYLDGRTSFIASSLWSLTLAGSTAMSLATSGFFSGGPVAEFAAGEYTSFSMNLLSPFDPGIKSLPRLPKQDEGYNYIGIGIIFLILISLMRCPLLFTRIWSRPVLPLLLMSILCTLLALSIKVTVGQSVLVTIPVPNEVFHALSIFRSSGRLFWPVHYLLILAAIVGTMIAFPSSAATRLVLAVALLIQIADLMPLRNAVAEQADRRYSSPLDSADWTEISAWHIHLVILPAWQCSWGKSPGGDNGWQYFARLAARAGLTVNSVYTARTSPAAKKFYCATMPETLLRQGPDTKTAYVLSDELAAVVAGRPGITHYCRRVDGLNLCTFDPARSDQSHLLSEQILFHRNP
jgi:hypothetical protein